MKTTIIRLLIILCCFVVLKYAANWNEVFSLLTAFVICYIIEPAVISKT